MPMVPLSVVAATRRVLAVRGGALGDFILTLPALGGLREAGFEVHLLTRPAYGQLAQDFGLVAVEVKDLAGEVSDRVGAFFVENEDAGSGAAQAAAQQAGRAQAQNLIETRH